MDIDQFKLDANSLIPAIIQDIGTNQVLMIGWMNLESIKITTETGLVTFWSRSRKKLWTKGETSGNFLHLQKMFIDCDRDSILIQVKPDGPTCHTGNTSCFYTELPLSLENLIEE